ncbi:MAG: hypothetical protein IJU37_00905, partial [Desulfovibrio sp.]|nr:hypothetical protein [Desulfovibrio sp.]
LQGGVLRTAAIRQGLRPCAKSADCGGRQRSNKGNGGSMKRFLLVFTLFSAYLLVTACVRPAYDDGYYERDYNYHRHHRPPPKNYHHHSAPSHRHDADTHRPPSHRHDAGTHRPSQYRHDAVRHRSPTHRHDAGTHRSSQHRHDVGDHRSSSQRHGDHRRPPQR